MKLSRKVVTALVMILICIIIHIYSAGESRVESAYSNHFFPGFGKLLRNISGWIPVSVGDFIYGIFVFWMARKGFKYIRLIFRKSDAIRKQKLLISLGFKILIFFASLYIIFNIFWGINYNRKGIAWQLGLKMEKYSTDDLKKINDLLADKINESKKVLVKNRTPYPSNKNLFSIVSAAYEKVSFQYPFLAYKPVSLKSSMWGWLGNYTGFTGYYNPFTGEAQLNTTVPKFLQPFIASHEVAHQLGYAKEMEANFVGYLAASASADTLLRYSVYLDIFTYANRNLFLLDSLAARSSRKKLDSAVVTDIKEWIVFNNRHRSIAEPVVRWAYGIYLKSNRQPQGILSYDEVTAFIISYYKKFGRI